MILGIVGSRRRNKDSGDDKMKMDKMDKRILDILFESGDERALKHFMMIIIKYYK